MKRILLIIYQSISILLLFAYYLFFMDYNALNRLSGDNNMVWIILFGFIGVVSVITSLVSISFCLFSSINKRIKYAYFISLFAGFTTVWIFNDALFIDKAYLAIDYILHILFFVGFVLLVDRMQQQGHKISDMLKQKEYRYLKDILIYSLFIIFCYIVPDQVFETYIFSNDQYIALQTVSGSMYIRYVSCYVCLLLHLVCIYKKYDKTKLICFILLLIPNLIYLCCQMFSVGYNPLASYFWYSLGFTIISIMLYVCTMIFHNRRRFYREKYRTLCEAERETSHNR